MLTLLVVIGALMLRAAWLEIYQQEWLQQQADKRQMRACGDGACLPGDDY